jgi:hypothetical protein
MPGLSENRPPYDQAEVDFSPFSIPVNAVSEGEQDRLLNMLPQDEAELLSFLIGHSGRAHTLGEAAIRFRESKQAILARQWAALRRLSHPGLIVEDVKKEFPVSSPEVAELRTLFEQVVSPTNPDVKSSPALSFVPIARDKAGKYAEVAVQLDSTGIYHLFRHRTDGDGVKVDKTTEVASIGLYAYDRRPEETSGQIVRRDPGTKDWGGYHSWLTDILSQLGARPDGAHSGD